MSEKVANGVLSGVVKVTGFFTSSVANSKAGKKFFSLLPGEIVLASLDGFGMDGLLCLLNYLLVPFGGFNCMRIFALAVGTSLHSHIRLLKIINVCPRLLLDISLKFICQSLIVQGEYVMLWRLPERMYCRHHQQSQPIWFLTGKTAYSPE